MSLEKVTTITGRGVFVPGADIDTDRIIPARFMKCVTFDGLGEFAFYDVRFDPSGNKTEHPLNDARFNGAKILIAGMNFGCGSSREHAPQSLKKYGFDALIAESFAEIFNGNCTTLAMPCVVASPADIATLRSVVEKNPATVITICLASLTVSTDGGLSFSVSMPESARDSLMAGRWDPIQELLDNTAQIEARATALGYVS
jgi:3-isopropylmalate/(R)-2-methylmalate dehydratase small subunit